MKRHLLIFGIAFTIYAALLAVTWHVGTHQAKARTEAMLDYAVNDIRVTMDGAIDTMLEHVAVTCVRHLGKARARTLQEIAGIAEVFDVDELNVVDRTGRIVASNDPNSLGVDMTLKDETRAFGDLTNGTTKVVSQPFRRNAYGSSRRKYLGVPFPGGDGYVQVGMDESRMANMIPSQLAFLFDSEMDDTVCYLCANMKTGALVSSQIEVGETPTLKGIGFDASNVTDSDDTFEQTIFGAKAFCRSFVFGGHRFIIIEPKSEFYGTRDMILEAMTVLLALVLGGFAFLMARISEYACRIKAFYAAENAARAKDMEIAKTIQNSALPVPLAASPYFRLSASMTPASDVGGDFYDFFMLDSTHVAFLVADVSGKGITGALYMMTAKTVIKNALLEMRDPAAAFTQANAELCRSNTANMFLTAWCGVVNLESGAVTFANAGHNPPMAVRNRLVAFVPDKSGPVLAFLDGVKYKSLTLHLNPGDTLFLYTDGVTEAVDAKGELFGEKRLSNAIEAVRDPDPQSLCTVVRAAVSAFSNGLAQADDITVLAIRYVASPRGFSRSFPPSQEGIAEASAYLDEIVSEEAARRDSSARLASLSPKLHVILDEICSNIVKHSGASGFEVGIGIGEKPLAITMTFTDDGVAYDPLAHAAPDISLPADKRPIGGLGIMMVKKMASSISYRRNRNRNLLTIALNAE